MYNQKIYLALTLKSQVSSHVATMKDIPNNFQ